MELLGNIKSYEWGKRGGDSKVAQLAELNASGGDGDGFTVDKSQPYAELWMGDHVSGPSSVKVTRALLSDALATSPHLLSAGGGAELQRLPYLFKVLSIETALSIQVWTKLE